MKKLTVLTLGLIAGAGVVNADIVINEVMQSNVYCIMDDINEFPDSWVELYNSGDAAVNLGGYRISLSEDFETAWELPSVQIAAGGYTLVYCDKAADGMHTDFRLDSGKCKVYLFDATGAQADMLNLKKQPAPDIAYGRTADAGSKWGYELKPTPGAANEGGTSDVVLDPVQFSEAGGVWTSTKTIQLKLALPDNAPEGAYIIYTTNGSEPTLENGNKFSGVIRFSTSQVVRAKAVCEGCISRPSNAQSYIFLGRDQRIPVISIGVNDEYLNDYHIGIFANGPGGEGKENYRYDWRRPINLEYFVPDESGSVINQLCETRVQGGYTRSNALKSLAVYANKRFGTKRFEYELWPKDKPGVTNNKSFILRNGGNDFMGCYVRDGLIQRLIGRNTDIEWQGYTPAIIFINGQYHAMLAVRERSNEDNIYSNFDELEDIDMVENWEELKAGDYDAFDEILTYIWSDDPVPFETWNELINIESYTNLMALNYWVYNTDFPHNNIVMWRKRSGDDTRWRWLVKDCDFGLGLYDDWNQSNASKNFTDFLNTNHADYDMTGYLIYRKLMQCPEFEDYFVRHLIAYCGDFLNAGTITSYCDEIVSENYGELGISHDEWKMRTWNFWSDLNSNISNMRNWITKRGNNIPKLIGKSFSLGTAVSVNVNKSMPEATAAELHLTYGGVPLSRGKFMGYDYIDRTIEITSAPDDDIVAWEVKVGSGAVQRVEGSSLTMSVDSKQDIVINAIIDHSGINDVKADSEVQYNVEGGILTAGTPVSVYDMSGRMVVSGSGRMHLPAPGLYIVKDNNGNTRKIAY